MEGTPGSTAVVPPQNTAAPPPPQENTTPFGWIKTPKGILRLVEWLFTLIMFATMASISNYDKKSEFKWMVAAGVLCWIYVFVLTAVYIFRARIEHWCTFLPVIEIMLDGVAVIFCLAAGAAVADRCGRKVAAFDGTAYEGQTWCKNDGLSTSTKNNFNASIVFAFFSMAAFAVSFFFSWRDNAREEAKK